MTILNNEKMGLDKICGEAQMFEMGWMKNG
jgi:hypothetical protein